METNTREAIAIALTLGVALALAIGNWPAGIAAGVLLAVAFSPVRVGSIRSGQVSGRS